MSDTKKSTAGSQILEHLRAKGKKARKAGTATTEELAAAIGQSVKYTYDRCFWMEKRDGVLQSTGAGKNRVWRTVAKARKPKAEATVSPTQDASEE